MAFINKITSVTLTAAAIFTLMPGNVMAYSSKKGWVEKDGKTYYYENGRKLRSTTLFDDNDKYRLLGSDGAMVTKKGWKTIKTQYTKYGDKYKATKKYYITKDGTVTTGWKKISGKYYFFDYDGKMAKGCSAYDATTKKYYVTGKDGVRVTKKGWYQATNTDYTNYGKKVSTKYYYYIKKDGSVTTGFKTIGGKKYYFDYDGKMFANTYAVIDKKIYVFKPSGEVVTKKGWVTIKYTEKYYSVDYPSTTTTTLKFYMKKDGTAYEGLKKINGKYYYFKPYMQKKLMTTIDGVTYTFGRYGYSTSQKKAG